MSKGQATFLGKFIAFLPIAGILMWFWQSALIDRVESRQIANAEAHAVMDTVKQNLRHESVIQTYELREEMRQQFDTVKAMLRNEISK